VEFHPVASIFPMMSAEEFKALKKSIQTNGQRVPIYTHEGKIVDGRNRYKACMDLGVKPRFEEWNGVGLLVDFVWDLNAERRQLTDGAFQIAAGKYAIEREAEAGRRELSTLRNVGSLVSIDTSEEFGASRKKAADKFGIGESTVARAMKVIKKGAPELVQAVESGQASVFAASQVATLPIEKQKEIVAGGKDEILKASEDIQVSKRVQKPASGQNGAAKPIPQKPAENKEIELQGMGVIRAHEAINCLKQIPKNDGLRKRGFQIVTDWIRLNQ
jgi:ParB-like chromosome segregation protein Spo0J